MTDEEYEHIPWSQLREDHDASRTRLVIVGAALVVGAVAGLFVGRMSGGAGAEGAAIAATPTIAVPTIGPSTPEAAPSVTTPAAAAAPSPTVAPPALYREADLLAVLPEEESRLAAMHAEWFVTDHFTVDGAEEPVTAPGGASGDAEVDTGTGRRPGTYVEWARAFRIDGSRPDRYLVDVAFRLLVEDGDGSFLRAPVRAVQVPVGRDASGALEIADLPSPAAAPPAARVAPHPPGAAVPADVEAAAQQVLAAHGLAGRVLSGYADAGGWQVVVEAGGGGVPSFPMVVVLQPS